jgi:hypothetical protein
MKDVGGVINLEHLACFQFEEEPNLNSLRLKSHFIFYEKSTIKMNKMERHSFFTIDLKCYKTPSYDVVVGGIVGFPKSGKTFLSDLILQEDTQNPFQSHLYAFFF